MNLAIAVSVFFCVLLTVEGSFMLIKAKWDPEARRVKKQLRSLASNREEDQPDAIMRVRTLSSMPWFNRMLGEIRIMARIDRLLVQANAEHNLGAYVLLSAVSGVGAFYLLLHFTKTLLFAIPFAAVTGVVPFTHIFIRKNRRMKKFEAQLPEALELLARSLRAGHAMVSGLQMVAQEFRDPMGIEIQKTVNSTNLGVSMEAALKSLTERVDCPDLKFLAVSIIIQRESGGNLAEILETIGSLIRARFKLQGRIRALAAEGKLSALILLGIPFVVAFILLLINPDYLRPLVEDPTGKVIVAVALLLMATGIFIMKKMIAIKV